MTKQQIDSIVPNLRPMNPEIKAKWLEALRSGKYLQTTGILCKLAHLSQPEKHCCLGVLCELAVKEGIVTSKDLWNGTSDGHRIFTSTTNHMDVNEAVLPSAVMAWAGISINQGMFDDGKRSLSSENDAGNSFEVIAKLIEDYF